MTCLHFHVLVFLIIRFYFKFYSTSYCTSLPHCIHFPTSFAYICCLSLYLNKPCAYVNVFLLTPLVFISIYLYLDAASLRLHFLPVLLYRLKNKMQLFTAVLLHIEQNIYFFNTDTMASFNVRFISAVIRL